MTIIKGFLIFSLIVLVIAIIYEWNKEPIYQSVNYPEPNTVILEPFYQEPYLTEEDCLLEQVNKRFGENFEFGRYYKDIIPDDLLFKGSFVPIKYLKEICKLS